MVAEADDRVVGFMIYRLVKETIHVVRFAVAPDVRRRGIGSQMLETLTAKLGKRRTRIALEVRETNLDAQFFYRDRGFKAIAVMRDYYQDTCEDAYQMQLESSQIQTQPVS